MTPSSFWVTDGTRTRDNRHHKPGLYQLSYSHHVWRLLRADTARKAYRVALS